MNKRQLANIGGSTITITIPRTPWQQTLKYIQEKATDLNHYNEENALDFQEQTGLLDGISRIGY